MQTIVSPILLIVFNRPDTTQIVFDAIKKFRPPKLYVSADAPRKENRQDVINCSLVRQIVSDVDWDCVVKYRFLDDNIGCGYGPSSAISWVLENEDRVIVLEDDCVPAQAFFPYCDYLLEKFKDDERIWLISGRSHHPDFSMFRKYDYIFSRYGHTWGWATWKRCWEGFDIEMKDLPLFLAEEGFASVFDVSAQAIYYRKKYYKMMRDYSLSSHAWDFQAGYHIMKNRGLCIVPSRNLIHNIGSIGTHSTKVTKVHLMEKCEDYHVAREPKFIIPNRDYEELHFKSHINAPRSFNKRVLKRLRRLMGWSSIAILH